MTLVDISKLEFEPFITEEGETVDYISAEELWKAPKIDHVNHAKWIIETKKLISEPDKMFVEHVCSNCGQVDHRDICHVLLWETTNYKDTYNPKLSNYCRNCGYKMDLGELQELYNAYKQEWCESRGYILEVVEEKGGLHGECYACFDEWYQNEYMELREE